MRKQKKADGRQSKLADTGKLIESGTIFGFSREFDRHQVLLGAQLLLREEANRRSMTMLELLSEIGLLTDQDKEIDRLLFSFAPGVIGDDEARVRLAASPVFRELMRRYRPRRLAEILGNHLKADETTEG